MSNHLEKHEKRTRLVVIITFVVMIVEIYFGMITKSMALLADGIHMGSHAGALGLSWIAYIIIRKKQNDPNFKESQGKILSLSGFTSGLILLVFALMIIVQGIKRFVEPVEIEYNEALIVAVIGLIINIASAFILHSKDSQHDQNIRAAYLHVLADALTSVTAIIGLLTAKIWGINHLDTIGGLISSFVIIKWSIGLLKESGKTLIDYGKNA